MKSIIVDNIEYRFFDHLYAVSACGKVLRKLEPYTPTKHNYGYLSLGRRRLMHRVIATCWIENPTNAKHVHHINGIKTDNRAENLEWLSPKEHFRDRHHDTHGHHTCSEEAKEKIRQSRLGKVTSEETKEKQRAALIGKTRPFFHRAPHSKESLELKSLNHPKNTQCKVNGVIYRSYSDASRELDIKKMTIRKRCLSKNFPDYELYTPTQLID